MSDGNDRIDVVVTDGIDPNVDRKLRAIAASADKGQASVLKLKAELASMNMTGVQKLKAEMETATTTLNKQLGAQTTLAKATDASAASDIKAATTKARLTAAVDAEAAAQARLAAVIDKTIARQEAAKVAAATTTFGKGGNPFQGEANLAAQAASVGAATRAMNAEVAAAEVATVGSFGRIKNAAMGAFDFMRDAAYAQASNFKGFFGAGGAATIEKEAVAVGKLGAHAKGSSTAVRELFVLAREAGRGDFTRMAGSATILANALGLMNTVLVPLAVVAGIAAGAMKLFQVSIQGDADRQLQQYSTHLGLTHKEMRKLGDETVSAEGKLKKFNTIKLTFGDVFHGLVKTIQDTFNLNPILNKAKNDVFDALSTIVKAFFSAAAELSGVMLAVYYGVQAIWKNFPAMMGDFFAQAVNKAAELMEDMVNDAIGAVNKFAKGANALIGVNLFGQISDVHIPRMKNQFAGAGAFVGNVITQGYKQGHDGAIKFDNDFLANWKKNSIAAGKDRLDALGNAIKGNRNPKKETDPKTKSDYLNDTNKKLDDELSRMHLLKDAREEQQRLDQIEEEFAKRRQPLTKTEIDGFRDKIHAIQEFKYQQAEMDRIYDAAAGPQKTYNAAIAAANDLMKNGSIDAADYRLAVGDATRALAASKDLIGANNALRTYQESLDKIAASLAHEGITQAQANEETNKAARAYAEAINPLFALNEAMGVSTRAAGLYGDQVQKNNYYEQIRQALIKAGKPASDLYVAGVNAEVDALMRKNAALQQQTYIQSQVGSIVNPMLDDAKFLANKQNFYAEIDRLRKTDVLNEQQAQRAKYAIQARYDEMRLQGASQFFGILAQLSHSHNKKLAAIGKAAAIAQATIDGYLAVQKALATIPPPFNIAVAAATAVMTGVQVAGILSTNVGNFRDGTDFMVQGNAGVDRNNINMNVSRGERITVQTPEQQRNAGRGGAPRTLPCRLRLSTFATSAKCSNTCKAMKERASFLTY
jgi:hypothetical protein